MPIFEFLCSECGQPFEELVRSASAVDGVTCPACGSVQVKKKISTFASKVTGQTSSLTNSPSTGSCSSGSV